MRTLKSALWAATLAASATADTSAVQEQKLSEPLPDHSYYGISVALEGNTAVVGASYEDHSGLARAGAVYVYGHDGAAWSQVQRLTAEVPLKHQEYGSSVALMGDLLVVGAVGNPLPLAVPEAYVYRRSGGVWGSPVAIRPASSAHSEHFGYSLALEPGRIFVGSPDIFDGGAAYVFRQVGPGWVEEAQLLPNAFGSNDWFGASVDAFGGRVVVGALASQGSAHVFLRTGTSWSKEQELLHPNPGGSDSFGSAVSIHDTTVAVGARNDDTPAGGKAGSVHLFERTGTTWTHQGALEPPSSGFGAAAVLVDDLLVVGAYLAGGGSGYLFGRQAGVWTELDFFTPDDVDPGDGFGLALAFDQGRVLGGAPFHGPTFPGPGAAYVFRLETDPPVTYCTAGTSASGCTALISSSGTPSASAPSGFDLLVSGVEGQKRGLFYYGANGRKANSWGGTSSFQCVVPPVKRGTLLQAVGTKSACDASYSYDLNAEWTLKPTYEPGPGAVVQAQFWYRDPFSGNQPLTSISDAIEFTVAP